MHSVNNRYVCMELPFPLQVYWPLSTSVVLVRIDEPQFKSQNYRVRMCFITQFPGNLSVHYRLRIWIQPQVCWWGKDLYNEIFQLRPEGWEVPRHVKITANSSPSNENSKEKCIEIDKGTFLIQFQGQLDIAHCLPGFTALVLRGTMSISKAKAAPYPWK